MRVRALVSLLLVGGAALAAAQTRLYVAWYGQDNWSGTRSTINPWGNDGPKATLIGARDALRALRASGQLSPSGAIVELEDGFLPVNYPVEFTAADSGTPSAPIVYRAAHLGAAGLDGSVQIRSWTTPSAAHLARLRPEVRGAAREARLDVLGVPSIGSLAQSNWTGDNDNIPSTYNELYINGSRQTIARWPNVGYAHVASDGTGTAFSTDLSTCRISPGDPGISIYSFATGFDWAFQGIPASVDPASGTVACGLSGPAKAGGRFFLQNSLEELDAPGEYYVDPATASVVYYPYPGQEGYEARIMANPGELIHLDSAAYVHFVGLAFLYCRRDAVVIAHTHDVSLLGITIRKTGGYGVRVESAENVAIDSCTMDDLGEGGVRVDDCGDYTTLTPGNVIVENCRITNFGRLVPSYRPGVMLHGVGNKALHNDILYGPHEAIHLEGVGLAADWNYIESVCLDTTDAGAIYVCGSAIDRGMDASGNLIVNIRNHVDTGGLWGIYMDGRVSGVNVWGNILRHCDFGIFVNGGRNNNVANNAALDCGFAFNFADLINYGAGDIAGQLAQVPYNTGIWAQTYPELSTLLSDEPAYPKYDVFSRNVAVRCGNTDSWRSDQMVKRFTLTPTDDHDVGWFYVASGDGSLFVNENAGNLCPVAYSMLWWVGFAELHEQNVGVQTNEFITGRYP